MTTKISSRGQIPLSASIRGKMALKVGDTVEVTVQHLAEGAQIVIKPRHRLRRKMKIITDPLTGWPVIKSPPGVPPLTNERVKELLSDFP